MCIVQNFLDPIGIPQLICSTSGTTFLSRLGFYQLTSQWQEQEYAANLWYHYSLWDLMTIQMSKYLRNEHDSCIRYL